MTAPRESVFFLNDKGLICGMSSLKSSASVSCMYLNTVFVSHLIKPQEFQDNEPTEHDFSLNNLYIPIY